MSYSSSGHLFYGFIPKHFDQKKVEDAQDENVGPCEILTIGSDSSPEYAIALRSRNFEQDINSTKYVSLRFDVIWSDEEAVVEFCETLGVTDVVKPRWYLGVSRF